MPKKGGFDLGKELSLNRKKYFLFSRLMKESPQKLKLRQLCKYAAVAPPNHSSELLSYLGDQHPRNYTAVPTTTKVYRYAELSRHRYIIQISRILCTKSRMKSFFSWKKIVRWLVLTTADIIILLISHRCSVLFICV